MENVFEGSFENFEKVIDEAIPDNIGMTDEEYEALLNAQIAAEFAKLDSKQTNQSNQSNQSIQTEEKEITMNTQTQAQVNETINTVTETAVVAAEPNTKVVAKKVAIILGKALAGAVVGGGLVVAGAHNHKAVNKAVRNARKKVGKVIPAVAPKPWWKF
jgi:hypothetical protein|nr:MAG TPA: hypothetical protein [Caudoviricetes sp.]